MKIKLSQLPRPAFQWLLLTVCCLIIKATVAAAEQSQVDPRAVGPRPNIVWITAEDMSPVLGCYGDRQAVTPHLDDLAAESIRFTHVFATAPVCSPVRSALITGRYAQAMGTHNMRSGLPLPRGVNGFPALLRSAGYYTSNNVKTDYNTSDEARLIRESWDESSNAAHWTNAPEGKPFFAVFNLMTSHQSRSMVWPYEQFQSEVQSLLPAAAVHDPAAMQLPPWYPDTPIVRRDWARFYDCVSAMDLQVGGLLQELRDQNLWEDTIVFFFSDHGSGMPRFKRALLDSGMHVPLLVRVPPRWQHLFLDRPGAVNESLVSFIDLPPTVLKLVGVDPPSDLQGRSLAVEGKTAATPRQYVFGHRDRVDEAFDCARSIRSRDHLLILNLMPHFGYHQPSAWPDQGQIRAEISEAAIQPDASPALLHYAGPNRPVAELYDCRSDPLNLNNLAGRPGFDEVETRLRKELIRHLFEISDRGFIPEILLTRLMQLSDGGGTTSDQVPTGGRVNGASPLDNSLVKHSIECALAFDDQSPAVLPRLKPASTPAEQVADYWHAIRLRSRKLTGAQMEELHKRLRQARLDNAAALQSAAAVAEQARDAANGAAALKFLIRATAHADWNVVLLATRELELLTVDDPLVRTAMRDVVERTKTLQPDGQTATFVQTPETDLAMFANFSAGAYLQRTAAAEEERDRK